MPLIGGGGSPNVSGGGNPAGTGTSITYIGDHAYAYSGTIAVGSGNTTMLDFTTAANTYIMAEVEFHGDISGVGNAETVFLIKMDGQDISKTEWNATVDHTLMDTPTRLLLPPATRVQVQMAQASGGDINFQATMTGRVYA
jgi:hypothetical protein